MAWPVRSAAAQVRWAGGPGAHVLHHAAEGALVDLAFLVRLKGTPKCSSS
jgi:hypothetical protein